MIKSLSALVALVALAGAAQAVTKGVTLQDRQQAACAKDVQRLCPDAMLDVDKATACMKDKRPQVSAECAAMYDQKS